MIKSTSCLYQLSDVEAETQHTKEILPAFVRYLYRTGSDRSATYQFCRAQIYELLAGK
jgi:hypothetical protein